MKDLVYVRYEYRDETLIIYALISSQLNLLNVEQIIFFQLVYTNVYK